MRFFLDTSNKKFIMATIEKNNEVSNFSMIDTDNDIVKNALPNIQKFLAKNNSSLNDVKEFLFTIGPGSFTGVKVSLNIVNSILLIKKLDKIEVIDTFKLLEQPKYSGTIVPFGKSKFYYKKNKKNKIKIITKDECEKLSNVNDGYNNFTKEILEEKIKSKEFKIVDNLDKVKIKYLSAF